MNRRNFLRASLGLMATAVVGVGAALPTPVPPVVIKKPRTLRGMTSSIAQIDENGYAMYDYIHEPGIRAVANQIKIKNSSLSGACSKGRFAFWNEKHTQVNLHKSPLVQFMENTCPKLPKSL